MDFLFFFLGNVYLLTTNNGNRLTVSMNGKRRHPQDIEKEFFERYPCLTICEESIDSAFQSLLSCYKGNGKLLIAGNGGSSADSDHITGELTKSFSFSRALPSDLEKNMVDLYEDDGRELLKHLEGGLPAIPLTMLAASNTAFSNDVDPKAAIAQLVNALGTSNDCFLGITTSGNSENIIKALMVAKAKGMRSILLTGRTGGKCKALADVSICVPEDETFKVQELHLPVYHFLCLMLESTLFEERIQ